MRKSDEGRVHDGWIRHPTRCPRGMKCTPLSRISSDGFASFMCCGDNGGDAPVKTDTFRLCVFSSHDDRPVDVLVNLDQRDVTHTAAVLLGGLASAEEAAEEIETWVCLCGHTWNVAAMKDGRYGRCATCETGPTDG